MADADEINKNAPSAADSLIREETITDKVSAAAEAVKAKAGQASASAGQMYQTGNAAVASRVDIVPAMVVSLLAGVLVGYCLGSDRQRRW